MPTGKARGTVRKKRKRETSLESDSLGEDKGATNSCIPVAKKVMHSVCGVKCAFIRNNKYSNRNMYTKALTIY